MDIKQFTMILTYIFTKGGNIHNTGRLGFEFVVGNESCQKYCPHLFNGYTGSF